LAQVTKVTTDQAESTCCIKLQS